MRKNPNHVFVHRNCWFRGSALLSEPDLFTNMIGSEAVVSDAILVSEFSMRRYVCTFVFAKAAWTIVSRQIILFVLLHDIQFIVCMTIPHHTIHGAHSRLFAFHDH